MKKQLLKFDSALGYYKNGDVAVRLSDGRYALIDTKRENAPPKISKGFVTVFAMSVLRGQAIIEDIPKELIDKSKRILSDPDSKIKGREWDSDPCFINPKVFSNSSIEKTNIEYLKDFANKSNANALSNKIIEENNVRT
ncbi:hypothetical protein HKO22_00540 [Peptoniphilus sp. AGMB00490]|uniref:Uncharacterized protein n=1 Tax=Peptoniphilus faecalis TaxID=2731255 RepID=A0A848RIR9_9FIRM|nr:hypothetical protein [Peptoniphilus faecalis]NMW84232.1 hypothetical protein [Peptoniphilus faecalis]